MAITAGHTAKLEYIEETTMGTPPTTGTLQIPSDIVYNVTIEANPQPEVIYAINDYKGVETITGLQDVTLSFDYHIQKNLTSGTGHTLQKSIEYYATNRTNTQPASLTFYYTTKSGVTLMLNGAVCNTLEISANADDKTIRAHAEFYCMKISTTPTNYNSLTQPAPINTAYEKFTAASITRGGATIEAGVTAFRFTINNNLERINTINSDYPTAIYAGVQEITGEADVLVSDGGSSFINTVMSNTQADLVFNTGSTAGQSEKFTFKNHSWTNAPLEVADDTVVIISSVPWMCEYVTLASY